MPRSRSRVRHALVAFLVGLISGMLGPSGCGGPGDGAGPRRTGTASADDGPKRTPLPRFQGAAIGGGVAGTDLFHRRRGILWVFSSTDPDAGRIADVVGRIGKSAAASNVALLGVNRDADPALGHRFLEARGVDFPVIYDEDFAISRKLRIPPGRSVVLVVDAEGTLLGGFAKLEKDIPDPEAFAERSLRELLRLEQDGALDGALGVLPEAPDATIVGLDGTRRTLSSLRGRVVVLALFSPLCPHCHAALRFLDRLTAEIDQDDLVVLPVSVMERRYLVEDMVEKQEIRLPVYLDSGFAVQKAYDHRYSVPDIVVIDRDGRIASRVQGFSDRIEALLSMAIRQTLGVQNVLLLDRKGYSGEESCRICHRMQHETWALTNHAYAFDTLVEHGADRDPECLPCHTVGWGHEGGYGPESPLPHLEGVQCENCHGRGGPHQSPPVAADAYEAVCVGCHNPKHSLGFVFGERLPLVSHAANAQFTALSIDERRRLIEERDRRARTLFTPGRFVGSQACASCHPGQHDVWSRSAHARAFDTLRNRGEASRGECQACHTTGYEKEGGYPSGGSQLEHVGCESCHGPGERHVADDPPRPNTILALADKCDSCVLLQICGSCHDPANDPGFEFELLDKLDQIRHADAVVLGSVAP